MQENTPPICRVNNAVINTRTHTHTHARTHANAHTHTHSHTHTHRHTHRFNGHFSRLASCPIILLLHLFLNCASFWDMAKLSKSSLTHSHQVLFACPSNSFNRRRHTTLDQSVSSLYSTRPLSKHLLLPSLPSD